MARITFSEAARQGFASRPTLYRRWKEGKLSVESTADGPVVDVSELVRVFGEPRRSVKRSKSDKGNFTNSDKGVTPETETEVDSLRDELRRLRDELEAAKADRDRERASAERERQNADRLLALLEQSQRQITDQTAGKPQGFLGRLFGRK